MLVQFAIEERRSRRCVGLLRADNANLFHGFAYVTMLLHPKYRMRAWPLEAAVLFGNYLFRKFNLRNIYAEAAESDLEQFGSGIGKVFEVEGCLRDRLIVDGHPENLYILSFKRERALSQSERILQISTSTEAVS